MVGSMVCVEFSADTTRSTASTWWYLLFCFEEKLVMSKVVMTMRRFVRGLRTTSMRTKMSSVSMVFLAMERTQVSYGKFFVDC
jgi:hypothetical protein